MGVITGVHWAQKWLSRNRNARISDSRVLHMSLLVENMLSKGKQSENTAHETGLPDANGTPNYSLPIFLSVHISSAHFKHRVFKFNIISKSYLNLPLFIVTFTTFQDSRTRLLFGYLIISFALNFL